MNLLSQSVDESPAKAVAALRPSGRRFTKLDTRQRDTGLGLTEQTVRYLSGCKAEPGWLLAHRLASLDLFEKKERGIAWAPAKLRELPFDQLRYYSAPETGGSGESPNAPVGKVLDEIGVRAEESTTLGGVQAQIDGEVVYGGMRDEWKKAGVIFVDSTRGLRDYAEIFRPYFGTIVKADENPFTRLNNAVFSGGSFIYVPPGVKVKAPMKCFMHLQASCGTQFGRTLIIADKGAEIVFMEGCTSAERDEPGLHCSVGEFVALPGSRIQYIAMQDWSRNIFNLAVLRAHVFEGASMQWIDCNLG